MSNSLQKIKRRWCAARLGFNCCRDRAVYEYACGNRSEHDMLRVIARAERSLRREFAREVRRASELPIIHRQVDADLIRGLPRVSPAAWAGDDPARHALLGIARRTVDLMDANLEGADAGICAYEQGFLTVEWLRDGEPVACAIAHDENALGVLAWL